MDRCHSDSRWCDLLQSNRDTYDWLTLLELRNFVPLKWLTPKTFICTSLVRHMLYGSQQLVPILYDVMLSVRLIHSIVGAFFFHIMMRGEFFFCYCLTLNKRYDQEIMNPVRRAVKMCSNTHWTLSKHSLREESAYR